MKVLELSNKYKSLLNQNGINSPLRLAHFFAQISHESQGFTKLRENLNYSVEGLLKTFGRHRISEAQAKQYGRTKTRSADQEALANILYGGKWGEENLGNKVFGDGFKFIGRGFKQLTGYYNYLLLSKDVRIDYVNHPEWLEREADAMVSACWFWKKNRCGELADANDIVKLTKRINGGSLGLSQREKLFKEYLVIFNNQ